MCAWLPRGLLGPAPGRTHAVTDKEQQVQEFGVGAAPPAPGGERAQPTYGTTTEHSLPGWPSC